MKQHRICLITPGHVASNPRLVKEAHALHEAGFSVHVIACRYYPMLDSADAAILDAAPWRHTRVDLTRGLRARLAKIRRRLARRWVASGGGGARWWAPAQNAAAPLLTRAATEISASLYIGHCLGGLAAAAASAARHRARYGFDAEDLHSAETHAAETDAVERRVTRGLEAALLPGCAHITAASPLIAEAYAGRHPLKRPPVTVLNVFPRSEAPAAPRSRRGESRPARLYWFSQTAGPGRGLESFVAALAKTNFPSSLHVRGIPAPGFAAQLREHARACGFDGTIEFHAFAPAADMVRLAATYDLGLSLEQCVPRNRDLCLTNKIFTYLLAGIPVALTPTRAQQHIAPELGAAALSLDLSMPVAAGRILSTWLENSRGRADAHRAAWQLGQTRFNWDVEKRALVESVQRALQQE